MASKSNPRAVAALLLLLVILLVVGIMQLRPSLLPGTGAAGRAPQVGTYKVPQLPPTAAERGALDREEPLRGLFAFGPPPTPTPDRRPTPTPRPTTPPPPPPPPTKCPYIDAATGLCLPRPPNFTMTYLGWLGPDRKPVAIFREGDEIAAVTQGETLKQKFIVRSVGLQDVTIGYVGYPENVTTKVLLAK